MPTTFIYDTDPSKHSNADTYPSPLAVIQAIIAEHTATFTGEITILLRCSSGIPHDGNLLISGLFPTAVNKLHLIGEISGGHPFTQSDSISNTTALLEINDPHVYPSAAKDAWFIKPHAANTNNRIAVQMGNAAYLNGLHIDGSNSVYVAGVYSGEAGATCKNVTVIGCNRDFFGGVRDVTGTMTFDQGTIKDCKVVQKCGPITNTIRTGTPQGAGDPIVDGSDNNAYDVDKASLTYAGSADANSVFSIDPAVELTNTSTGGYTIKSGSALATMSSTGGPIGAFADAAVGNPPNISIVLSGNTLNAVVSDDLTANPSLQLNIENTPTGAVQTATAWDLTSYGLANGYHRLTVTATDDDGNSATSEDTFYSVGGVMGAYFIGNSISNVSLEPTNTSNANLADMVKAMFQADGSDLMVTVGLRGGSGFDVFAQDQAIMNEVSSGDYTVVMMQTYLDEEVSYYEQYLKPMVDAAKGAGSDFSTWYSQLRENEQDYHDTFVARSDAGTTAAGSEKVQPVTAWHAIRAADPTIDLYADNTHQNEGGLYVSALSIYVYLSGKTANSVSYEPPSLQTEVGPNGLGYTAAQVQLIKDKVDETVTDRYVQSIQNTCSVTITTPSASAAINENDSITFSAVATDSVSGDLSAGIEWKDGATVLHTGAGFTTTELETGSRLITANRVGSDGNTSTAARNVQVTSLVNAAPITVNSTREIFFNEAFEQVPLGAFVTDDNDQIDWSTLSITQQPANAAANAVQDTNTLTTVNVNYSGTDFSGADSFKYTVADAQGAVSNEATVTLNVLAQDAPAGVIANNQITRGLSFDMVMSNYTAGASIAYVEVWVKDVAGDGTEYPCIVTVNTDGLISANTPTSAVLAMALSGADVLIKPITTLGS